jgi:hypothetical protein
MVGCTEKNLATLEVASNFFFGVRVSNKHVYDFVAVIVAGD